MRALPIVIAALLSAACSRPGREVRRFNSPDGRYAIVVRFDEASVGPGVPGSGSDRPGYVQLVDAKGRVFQQTRVDMVQLVDQIYWEPDKVEVKLIATWRLP